MLVDSLTDRHSAFLICPHRKQFIRLGWRS